MNGALAATRWRQVVIGVLLVLSLWGSSANAAGAANGDECEDALLGEWACSTLNDIPGVNRVYEYLGDVHRDKVEAVTGTLGDVVPDNFIEEWVTGMAESTVTLLAYIQELGEKATGPAFDQAWWASQYATSFGLSLIVLALLLVWITSQLAASGGSLDAVDLFRQSGWRLVFVVPLISAGPLALLELQLAANDLARLFADEGTAHAGSAVERLMQLIIDTAGDWGVFGGTVLALILFLCILCLGLVTLIEMAIAQWGLHLGSLLVPLVLVAWVYPPWSGGLRRLSALIAGLMLLPAFIYFFFNTIWAAFDSLMRDHPEDDGLTILLFLVVGLFMIDAFPAVVMWLMSMAAPGASGMEPQVRGAVVHPSGGEMMAGLAERFEARMSRVGTRRTTGGDGPPSPDPDDDGTDSAGSSGPADRGASDSGQPTTAGAFDNDATASSGAHEPGEDDGTDDSRPRGADPATPEVAGDDGKPDAEHSTGAPAIPPARQPDAADGPDPEEARDDE